MRLARWIAVALAVGVALGVVVLIRAPVLIEHRVERALSAPELQAEVGRVDVGWREGRVTLRGLRIVDARTQQTALEAPEIRIDVALGTLLPGGSLRIERVEADAPFVDLNSERLRRAPWLQGTTGRSHGRRALEIDSVQVKNGTLRVPDKLLERKAVFTPVDVRLEKVGAHSDEERFPTKGFLTATLEPGGRVRIELRTDLTQPQPTFDIDVRGEALPLEVLGKRLGLNATSGTASLGFHALLENGAYDGRVGLHVEDVGLGDKGGALGELKEQATELGLGVAGETGLLTRERRFEGRLQESDLSLSAALRSVLEQGFRKLGEK